MESRITFERMGKEFEESYRVKVGKISRERRETMES
jgi:hypothetical protein